jgi:hypothetical protein
MQEEWVTDGVRYLILITEGARGAWILSLLLAGGLLMLMLGLRQRPRRISLLGLALVAVGMLFRIARAMTIRFNGEI